MITGLGSLIARLELPQSSSLPGNGDTLRSWWRAFRNSVLCHGRLQFFRSVLFCVFVISPVHAADRPVGDLDNDGVVTALDLARQISHASGQMVLPEGEAAYADLNRDGIINSYDSALIIRRILQTDEPAALPLAAVLETSPANGEAGIALTREFTVHFTMPLALDAVFATYNPNTGAPGNLYAEFGGRRLLARAELSSDRRKATLFFLEPLPSSARVRVTFNSAGLKDILGRNVDGDGDAVGGGVKAFDFDTLGITPLTGTGVTGRVFGIDVGTNNALSTRPLAGVTITVDGAEQTLRTTTATDGTFTLTPAPAGRFFVLVDGRTAGGTGGYYAFVGKAWEGIPGRLDTAVTPATADTAPGDIYLPFIPTGTLQPVSATQDTTITFSPSVLAADPALADVQIMVPANSLFADNGARGGRVGIAPVAPGRLPEPLPPGLKLPLVITIQTDGATNFDRPVPVRFPNLPDTTTGKKPLPGAKSALVSFNHDTGTWELVGPMTVAADGKFVETDPGVGVRQPGWHGNGPFGSLGGGGRSPCREGVEGNNEVSMLPGRDHW